MKTLLSWIRRLLFGKVYTRQQEALEEIFNRLNDIEGHLQGLDDLVLEIVDMTGGVGWTSVIQNAILQLDDKIDSMRTVLIKHQENFEMIVGTEDDSEEGFVVKVKDNLN